MEGRRPLLLLLPPLRQVGEIVKIPTTQFVEKQTLQVPFDLKLNTDYNHQGLKSGKLLKTPRNWVGFAAIVNV